jgi:hypothetical protein
MTNIHVKVISLQGCSATPPTIDLLKETAKELKAAIALEHVFVESQEEAVEHRHIGSPTVLVNGIDIEPEAREIYQFGIT